MNIQTCEPQTEKEWAQHTNEMAFVEAMRCIDILAKNNCEASLWEIEHVAKRALERLDK